MKLESLKSENFQVVPKSAMSKLVGGDLKYDYTTAPPGNPGTWDNDRRAYTMDGNNKIYEGGWQFKCLEEEWPMREITGPFGMDH